MSVISINSARGTARPDQPAECNCGSQWFTLAGRPSDPEAAANGGVTLSADGLRVTGYVGEPRCIECGAAFTPPGGWHWA